MDDITHNPLEDTRHKRGGKRAAYQGLNIGEQLQAPGFAPSSNAPLSLEPVVATPMEITLDQLQAYQYNPRTSRNPQYDEIKDSIRHRGLDHPPPISRRPGESLFTIVGGGNTRLAILNELYTETGRPEFFRIQCLYQPWKSESHALIGHLVENEQRGEMTFIDKAVAIRQAQLLLEQEQGQSLSQRKLSEALRGLGISVSQAHINKMFQCLDQLLPVIPGLLHQGLGKPQIEKALQLRALGLQLVQQSGKHGVGEPQLHQRFAHALSELEEEGTWDFDSLKHNFATQLGLMLGQSYSRMTMELDALLNDRTTTQPVAVPPVILSPSVSPASAPEATTRTEAHVPKTDSAPPVSVTHQAFDELEPGTAQSALGQTRDQPLTAADAPLRETSLPDGSQVLLPQEVVRWGTEASTETQRLAAPEAQQLAASIQAAPQNRPWHSQFQFCQPHLANALADARRYFLYRTPQAPGSHGLELDLTHSRVWLQMTCEAFLRQMQLDTQLVRYWPLATGVYLHVPHTADEQERHRNRFPLALAPLYFMLWDLAGYNSHEMLSLILSTPLADKLPALNALMDLGIDEPNAMRERLRSQLYPELPPGGTEAHLMALYAGMSDEQRAYFMLMMEGHRNLHSRWSWAQLLEPDTLG